MSAPAREARLATVRKAVRGLLESSEAFRAAPEELRRKLAARMVDVSMLAADQIASDLALSEAAAPHPPALAEAQAEFGDATRMAAQTVRDLREGIDFPNFVTSLITGVFQAISTSSLQQLEAVGDLLQTVSASSSEFSADQISDAMAIRWAVQAFSFLRVGGEGDEPRLELKPGQELQPHRAALARRLEAAERELGSVSEDEIHEGLLPLVKRKMGRDRQANLATMVMLGMNRIVVDEGRLHASMDLRVDTRSVAEQRRRERTDVRVDASAQAQFGVGAWGASASLSTSVGYVKDDQSATREEIATQAGLRSSVDLTFHTEPIALDRLAPPEQQQRIRSATRVPAAWEDRQSLLSTAPGAMTEQVTLPEVPGRGTGATPPPLPNPRPATSGSNPAQAQPPASSTQTTPRT